MANDPSVEQDQSNAAARRAKGEFVRGVSGFHHAIGDPDFPVEPGRYHLVVALNCPWCHRVTLTRN
ncbi:MAG: glutathione S-transferase, partial [Rhodobacteraceae bacterium]|nr:glutathione S-transferase [Paracoccaceae bacterium]